MMNRLKELRKEKGITLSNLSNILKKEYGIKVCDSQLSNYENGNRTPRNPEIWSKLADYFNVSESYLLGYEPTPLNDIKTETIGKIEWVNKEEFKKMIEDATKKAEELEKSIQRLNDFELQLKFAGEKLG